MRRPLLAAILPCLLPAVLFADAPRAVINGPTKGEVGDVILLDGSGSIEADKFLWAVKPAKFKDGKPTFRVSPDRRSCHLASRIGTYQVMLIVSNEDGPDYSLHSVTVTTPAPPAPPEPTPPATPVTPAVPLTNWVTENATLLVTKDPDRAGTSIALAAAYRSFIDRGARLPPDSFAKAQRTINANLLDQLGATDAWDSFLTALYAEIAKGGGHALPGTIEDCQAAWEQIAAGLARVQ